MIRRKRDDEPTGLKDLAPNLTPLLDVLFMLLIFLVLTANTAQFALDIALPGAVEPKSTVLAEREVVVTLYAQGETISVDGETVPNWAAAQEALAKRINAAPDAWYLIAGDKDVPLSKLVRVLSFLQSRNVAQVRILVGAE